MQFLKRVANDFMGWLVEIPSGSVDPGEDYISALVRETKEETFLETIRIQKYIGYFDYISSSGKKARQLNFLIQAEWNILLSDKEHDKYYWLTSEDLDANIHNISDNTKSIVKQVL